MNQAQIITPIISNNLLSFTQFRKSTTPTPSTFNHIKEDLIEELMLIVNDWEDELRISDEIVELAENFIENLPHYIKTPSISVENQDAILFEWVKKLENEKVGIFSVIIEKDRIIYSTYNLNIGGEESKGVINMCDMSIELILNIVSKYFKENHAQRYGHIK